MGISDLTMAIRGPRNSGAATMNIIIIVMNKISVS